MSKPTPTRSTTTASYPTFLDLPPNCNSTSTSTSTSKALPHHPSISLLPFSITYAGPTDVSSQFPLHPSTPTKRSDGTLELHSEASFRGRLLISSRVNLPQGYRGWVVESRKPTPATIATTISTDSDKVLEEKVVKKVKIEGGRMGNSFRGRGGKVFQKGTRTSPRKKKKKVVVRYSLDSDEELEGDKVGEDEEMKIGEEVEEARTKEEEEEERTMVDTPHESIESSSTSTTTTTIPSALVSLSTTFSSLPDNPNEPAEPEPEPEPEIEIENFDEAPLARDEIHLLPIASFASIDLWNPDSAADLATDVYARSLGEWTGIAAKLHAY